MENVELFESFKFKSENPLELNSLFLNDFLSDTIIVNKTSQKEFFVHKAILASSCQYFYFNLKDSPLTSLETRDGKIVIYLPSKNSSKFSKSDEDLALQLLLKFIYNNQNFDSIKSEINRENVFTLLSLTHCLRNDKLANYLTNLIKEDYLTTNTSVRILFEGMYFENDSIIKEAISLMQKEFYNVTKNLDEFAAILELPFEIFLKIINDSNLNVDSEKQICDLVFNYIKIRQNIPQDSQTNIQASVEIPSEEEKQLSKEPEKIQDANQEKKETEAVPNKEINENSSLKLTSDYNEAWNLHIKNLNERLKKKSLTKEEIRKLIESIRFSFLSHSDLLSLSTETLMTDHKDLILEGLSMRLHSYENTNSLSNVKINTNPRIGSKTETPQKQSRLSENLNEIDKSQHKEKEKSLNMNLEDDFVNISLKPKEILNSYQNTNMSYRSPYKGALPKVNTTQNSQICYNNPRPPQDHKTLMNSMSRSHIKKRELEFNYESDFDENGVFYYLGSLGKTSEFQNPHNLAQVKVFSSSLGQGKLSDLVGRTLVNLRTLNEPMSYFGIDLGPDRYLIPTCYSIKNRNSSSHVLVCWTLEGSNDRINFEILDTRIFASADEGLNKTLEKERAQLRLPGATSTWGISSAIKDKFPNGFRYFVLRQTGPNSSGGFNLALSGLELYGKGLGRWSFC